MDPAMLALLGQRMGLDGDELQAMQDGNPAAVLAGRLANGQGDPMLAAMMGMLAQQQQHHQEPEPDPEPAPDYERALRRARQIIASLRADLGAADTMTRHVAAVFGACPSCWGQSAACAQCGGEGGPGWLVPRRDDLIAWCAPALARFGLVVAAGDPHRAG